MSAWEEKGLYMLHSCSAKEKPVFTEKRLRLHCLNTDNEIFSGLRVSEPNLFKAHASCVFDFLGLLRSKSSNLDRDKVHGVIGVGRSTIVTFVYSVISDPLSIDIMLADVVSNYLRLTLVV